MRNPELGINSVVFRSTLGWAGAAFSELGICRIVLPKKSKRSVQKELERGECSGAVGKKGTIPAPVVKRALMLLNDYFSGTNVSFDLPLDIGSYTRFQQAVWKAAAEIPFGETRSYGWIAKRVRSPRAARAVGQALGVNPVPIIIP